MVEKMGDPASGDRIVIVTGRYGVGGSRRGPKHVENEDRLGMSEPDAADPRAARGNLYVVADGVGGHMKGEVASTLAVEALSEAYYQAENPDIAANLLDAIN